MGLGKRSDLDENHPYNFAIFTLVTMNKSNVKI